jgi:hypothetical protein
VLQKQPDGKQHADVGLEPLKIKNGHKAQGKKFGLFSLAD